MKEQVLLGGSSVTVNQLGNFFRLVKDGNLGFEEMQSILEHYSPWPDADLDRWSIFYQKYFNCTTDFSGLKILPKPILGKWRLLVILKGLTNYQVFGVCQKLFPCWKYTDDLEKTVFMNERDPKNGTYAIWISDMGDIDEVQKIISVDMAKEASFQTETFLERMIHELMFFLETGENFDVANVMVCNGSSYSDSGAP